MTVTEHNNRWYYNFMIDGVRYHKAIKGCTNYKDAIKAESIVKSEVMKGHYGLVEKINTTTFGEAVELYLEYSRANKRSHKLDENYCNVFIEEWGSKTKLQDITPQMIERFKLKRKKVNANATINRYLEALSKLFNIAIDNGLISTSPMKLIKKLLCENHKIRFLTKEEEKSLFMVLHKYKKYNYLIPIITCALQTGMRKSEILKLKWSNVDFKEKYIELLKTKSGKPRKIPISQKLLNELKKLLKTNHSEYVFSNPSTLENYRYIHKGFSEVLKKAEIKNFRFHDLRHTAATRMTEKGIDLAVVQEILGHSDIKTTMRYAHPVPERKLKAIEALNNYI